MKAVVVPIIIGGLAVVQGGLNRLITSRLGLFTAVFINSLVLLALAFSFWFFVSRPQNFQWQWWYFIPAMCGFFLLLGIPWAIPQIGALRVFLCIVIGQMITSLIWDMWMEGIPVTPYRMFGALLAIAGLFLASK